MGSGSATTGGAVAAGAAACGEADGANCAHAHADHRAALSAHSQTVNDLCLVTSDMVCRMSVRRTTKWRGATLKLYRDGREAAFTQTVRKASTTGAAAGDHWPRGQKIPDPGRFFSRWA